MIQQIIDTKGIGKFIQTSKENEDPLKFLSPSNWVFHDEIVDKVLKGNYFGIRPICSEFDATLNCSNRCGECAYKYVKIVEGLWDRNNFLDQEAHMKNPEFAKELILKLKQDNIKGIIFTGGGEPFLFKGLEDVVQYTTSLGIDSVCYTNGNILSELRIKKLLEADPLLVRVSLNAGSEEVYNKFHNPFNKQLAFYKTLNTIEFLALGSLNHPRTSIGVGYVINEINQHDMVNAALRLREISDKGGKIDFVCFRPEFNYYNKKQLSSELLDRTHEIVEKDVRKTLQDTNIYVDNVHCRFTALKEDTRNYSECRASALCSEISCMGAFFCCDRNFNRRYYIGNLEQSSLDEIYSGEQRQKLHDYVKSNGHIVCPPACKSHETNKQFEQIEKLREQGKINLVKDWIDTQRKMPKPKMVNFI